jgi:hypothetical protein
MQMAVCGGGEGEAGCFPKAARNGRIIKTYVCEGRKTRGVSEVDVMKAVEL